MPTIKAVQFADYGDVEVLQVRTVPCPSPKAGEVLIQVRAAGINPGETVVRRGGMPGKLPSGQGVDLAGIVTEVGADVESFRVGDEVLGFCAFTARASQAEFAVAPAANLTAKPPAVAWDVAGALFTAGATAYAAVRAVGLAPGEVVAIAAATGGVGTLAVQLAKRAGATVLGIAGPSGDDWLTSHGAIPVNYEPALADRLQAAAPGGRVDAFLDFFGNGYVQLALELGVLPARVNTTIDLAALIAYPIKAHGNLHAAQASVVAELAQLIANDELEVPIAATYPLDQVQDAFRALEQRHTRGKIVLRP